MTTNPITPQPLIIPTQIIAKLKLQAIKEKRPTNFYLDQYRAELIKKSETQICNVLVTNLSSAPNSSDAEDHRVMLSAADIPLNEEQQEAYRLVIGGHSICLIGPAGTGKTSTVNQIIRGLIASERIQKIGHGTKAFLAKDYAMIGCAYTRRARDNLARNSPPELPTSTLHSLIEFAPSKIMKADDKGNIRESMIFEPTRNQDNPLPVTLQLIIIDESSMVSTELYNQVIAAIHPLSKVQFVFLGDLAQLPPVFGHAILGFKLLELPVVELKKVYRQKDGEILDFATQVRQGIPYKSADFSKPWCNNNRLHIYTSKQVESIERRTFLAGHKIQELIHTGQVSPENGDFILCPYNKQFGTMELNNWAADYYDQRDNRRLYTVIAGYQKKHFAIGDKVLIDKRDAIILGIDPNPGYSGPIPPMPSNTINRWGVTRNGKYLTEAQIEEQESDEDYFNSHMSSIEEAMANQEKSSNQASHIITYQLVDTGTTGTIKTTGDVNAMELAFCISVHKSQGSQASTVVLFLSRHHRRLQCRELLYTAATRAINKLLIFADPDSINKCIRTPIIKGDTLEEKAIYFQGLAREQQAKDKLGDRNGNIFDDIDIGED
jgi:exodeoxyribonuclease V alpha subunit